MVHLALAMHLTNLDAEFKLELLDPRKDKDIWNRFKQVNFDDHTRASVNCFFFTKL